MRFRISAAGKVLGADASGVDDEVARCVRGVVDRIEFPVPRSEVDVVQTFVTPAR